MGIAEISKKYILYLKAKIIVYGNQANKNLALAIAGEIEMKWNEPQGYMYYHGRRNKVVFKIQGQYNPGLSPQEVAANNDPLNNYFRIESYADGNISFVDDIGSNTGYFKLENLTNNSTTAAHEFGHTLGLIHPANLDIRGKGVPGIMYPRGTITDPQYQYDPSALPGAVGGTLDPFYRKVRQEDIDLLGFSMLSFASGTEIIGKFTNNWHEADLP